MYSVCTVILSLICMPLAPIQQASFQVPVCFKCNFWIQCASSILPNFNILSVLICYYVLFKRGDIMYWACHDVKSVITANARYCFCTSFTLYSNPAIKNKCVLYELSSCLYCATIHKTNNGTYTNAHTFCWLHFDRFGRMSILEIVLQNVKALYN